MNPSYDRSVTRQTRSTGGPPGWSGGPPRLAGGAPDPPAAPPGRARRRLPPGWVALLIGADLGIVAGFLWLAEHTSVPLPLVVVLVVTTVGLLVGPWAYLAATRLEGETAAGRIVRRVLVVGGALAGAGLVAAATVAASGREGPDAAGPVAMFAILVAGLLTLVGVVVFPWLFLLARTVTRERAARVRAEERAEVATHLHDSVLQTLTLIQKRRGDPGEMARLARHAERELRGWLYGAPDTATGARSTGGPPRRSPGPPQDDLVGALRAAAAEVEDRHGVAVELVAVGTCRLDERARAVAGAAAEALTNAAKHAGVPRVSLFAEVADGRVLVVVRDRGRGFDPAAGSPGGFGGPPGWSPGGQGGGRGIPDSIVGRMRRQGGEAAIRSAPGAGTEVELRMPVAPA
jgi:signal transduction histidine kinase